jgi:FMN reductase
VLSVAVVVGNPKPQSRTLRLATTLPRLLLPKDSYELAVVDLADYARCLFDWPSPRMSELSDQVSQSDLIIVGSPTYKGSYSGLLKSFMDRYPNLGLNGVTAVPLMTGSDLRHYLGVEVHLRPLLIELGASVPTAGLYFVTAEMDRADQILEQWVTQNAPFLSSIISRTT